jgi:hypothetical protein
MALLIGLVVLVAAVFGGAVVIAHKSSSPAAIQSPAQANTGLYAAAVASGSFHYVDFSSGTDGGHPVTSSQSGDDGRTEGVQYNTSAFGDSEVIVINSMAYMRSDLTMLENTFGYSLGEAAPYVNRWIAFSPTDSLYSSIAADVTTGSTWGKPSLSPTDGLPHTPLSVSAVSGQPLQSLRYSIRGTNRAANASYTGSESIAFSAVSPHLPSTLTEQVSGVVAHQSSSEVLKETFSHWGESVAIAAPTDTVPFSALPAPSTTT